jgi:hypothetical protein
MKSNPVSLLVLVASLASASLLQGCLVAAVGAGIGAAKYGSAKEKEAYSAYRIESDKLNFEREKAGFQPNSVMTYDEWKEGKK